MWNEVKTYTGLLGFIALILSYLAKAVNVGDPEATFVLFGLGTLSILLWLLWVTGKLRQENN